MSVTESREKRSEERQADMIYLLMVFVAFIAAVMVMVSVYSDKGINIYVVSNQPEMGNTAAVPEQTVSNPAEEQPVYSEPEDLLETSQAGPQEVLMAKSVDINHADREELEKLPGIGPVLAERIVEYRTSYGDFSDIEEIMEVNGIGEKTFAKIRDFIYVSK